MFPIRDNVPRQGIPVVTWALIAANTAVFLYLTRLDKNTQQQFFYIFGLVPARFSHPAWAESVGFPDQSYLPFLTSMFLHGGWLHLIGNMWVLWIFGESVEFRMGAARYFVFYMLIGLIAAVTQWATNIDSMMPTVGASGAIAGVLGAYLFLYPRARLLVMIPLLLIPFFFEIPAFLFLVIWFLAQIFSGTLTTLQGADVGGIAWWAHVGGFVSGALLHWFFLLPRRLRLQPLKQVEERNVEGAWHDRF
ncbi:MAG TPA: rhomboid family intramembrane serine protease [Planctomycetota bacterium]|nr:rhomboid family intramembrane serine protease [Planctomycetota bacterium]